MMAKTPEDHTVRNLGWITALFAAGASASYPFSLDLFLVLLMLAVVCCLFLIWAVFEFPV